MLDARRWPGVETGMGSLHMAMRSAAIVAMLALSAPATAEVDPVDVIDRVDRLLRGDSSRGVVTMEIVTENWDRTLSMEAWSLGTDFFLARLRSPKKEAGVATLKAGNNIWNYLPKIDRTLKIPTSMMGGAWMGSHFTNDDLVKQSRLSVDYAITLSLAGDDPEGVAVWDFMLTPKPDAAVVWGHIVYRVRQDDLMPLWATFHDEDGLLARTMEFSGFREFDGRLLPSVMHMRPADKPEEHTVVRYEELDFDIDVTESFFSLRNLKKSR